MPTTLRKEYHSQVLTSDLEVSSVEPQINDALFHRNWHVLNTVYFLNVNFAVTATDLMS